MKYIISISANCNTEDETDTLRSKFNDAFRIRPLHEGAWEYTNGVNDKFVWLEGYVTEDPRPALDILIKENKNIKISASVDLVNQIFTTEE